MRPDRDSGREVTGALHGQRIDLTVDHASLPHLMNVLTDMYADPEAAVLREYTTNARDSHVAAGTTRPIEVELPTPLAPVLRVRDFGVGLSLADLENIYSKYGASTKRDTNAQTGMLGLGCKAALTYSDTFTLTATKDGERAQVAVARNEAGAGTLTVVDVSATDDPNGVEVAIPAKRNDALAEKAAALFAYWPRGAVLVNGKPPAPVDGLRLSDRLLLTAAATDTSYRAAANRHRVVMGGVPYPAEFPALDIPRNRSLVAFVDIGAVHFPASREALLPTPKTAATLAALADEYRRELDASARRAVASAPDRPAALAALTEWSALPGLGSVTFGWRGRSLPAKFALAGRDIVYVPRTNARYSAYLNRHDLVSALAASAWPRTVFVTGFGATTFTAVHRRRLDAHASGADDFDHWALLPDDALPGEVAEWIEPGRVVAWADTRPTKAAGAAAIVSYADRSDEYDVSTAGETFAAVPLDAILRSGPVYWTPHVSTSTCRFPNDRETRDAAKNAAEAAYVHAHRDAGGYVVRLPANRVDKFLRLVPGATNVPDLIRAEHDKWRRGLDAATLASIEARESRSDTANILRDLDPTAFRDPAFQKLVAAHARLDATAAARLRADRFYAAGIDACRADGHRAPDLTAWPLLVVAAVAATAYNPLPSDDVALYVNAVHAARKRGTK